MHPVYTLRYRHRNRCHQESSFLSKVHTASSMAQRTVRCLPRTAAAAAPAVMLRRVDERESALPPFPPAAPTSSLPLSDLSSPRALGLHHGAADGYLSISYSCSPLSLDLVALPACRPPTYSYSSPSGSSAAAFLRCRWAGVHRKGVRQQQTGRQTKIVVPVEL